MQTAERSEPPQSSPKALSGHHVTAGHHLAIPRVSPTARRSESPHSTAGMLRQAAAGVAAAALPSWGGAGGGTTVDQGRQWLFLGTGGFDPQGLAIPSETESVPAESGSADIAMGTNRMLESEMPGRKKLRGVFYQGSGPFRSESAARKEKVQVRTGDFRQCLDALLSGGEEEARVIARTLYARLDGDLRRLPALLEERWGFPFSTFQLLWTHLRRTTGGRWDAHNHGTPVDVEAWAEAFVQWLQVLQVRCTRTKVSRQCFVQTRTNQEWAKIYFMGMKLGEGSYGEVHLALHTALGMARVVKSVPKAQLGMAEDHVEEEVAALKSMDHPHIVRIFEAFETGEALHIVMDYAEGGDLGSAIRQMQGLGRTLPKAWVRAAAGQVASALFYMHSKGVIHCDLKPQNAMLLRKFVTTETEDDASEPHVLLADFGLAEIFEESPSAIKTKTVKGTPSYLSPEGFDGRLSNKSDTWSFGVMLFEMLVGQRPWRGSSNVFLLFCQIMKETPPLQELPTDALGLVTALLEKDPVKRWGAKQCLQHPWFKEWFASAQALQPNLHGRTPEELGHASYFYRAVMFCVASALGMKDFPGVFETFRAMDTDAKGYLTKQQLTTGLERMGINQDPVATMSCLDLDQDGYISLTEFLAGALRMDHEVSESLLRYAFATFDADSDGHISREDLQDILERDGASTDMLPDGLTVDQVMDEVSRGEGTISFKSFHAYLRKMAENHKVVRRSMVPTPMYSSSKPISKGLTAMVEEVVRGLVSNSDMGNTDSGLTIAEDAFEFPSFNHWLAELFQDTQQGAALSRWLVFQDRAVEESYVGQNLSSTCRRVALLAVGLFLYSVWALTTENSGWLPRWSPSIVRWDSRVRAINNVAWIVLAVVGILVMLVAGWELKRRKVSGIVGGKRGKGWSANDDFGQHSQVKQACPALGFERFLCVTGCILPWICCWLANRSRVAALFKEEAREVFESLNSDYDLIVCMLGTLMYLTTLTHVRLVCAVFITTSCALSYLSSSFLLGAQFTSCNRDQNWVWPWVLLMLVAGFNLWGHQTVEQHRRLTFLSLHASYTVLKEAHDGNAFSPVGELGQSGTISVLGPESENETRYARFKQAAGVLRRLADSMEAHKPVKAALSSLLELLNGMRDDMAQADRLHLSVDFAEALQRRGVTGTTQELLLGLFDSLPPSHISAEEELHRLEMERLNQAASNLCAALDNVDAPRGGWGWDILTTRSDAVWPLIAAAEEIVLPAVAVAAATGWSASPKEAGHAKARAGRFLEGLARTLESTSSSGEARAALTLRAAHWLAHRLGLWARLEPWERVAMLLAAAGLHCGSSTEPGNGGAIINRHPLLEHAASVDRALQLLDHSGLATLAVGFGEERVPLWKLVNQLMLRVRPQYALDDAYRIRVELEHDDRFPVSTSDRLRMMSMTIAAADLAFLALPASFQEPWIGLCTEEARNLMPGLVGPKHRSTAGTINIGLWLQGLAETVALPLYETLGKFEGSQGTHASAPLRQLRSNLKRWKTMDVTISPQPARPAKEDVGKHEIPAHPFEVPQIAEVPALPEPELGVPGADAPGPRIGNRNRSGQRKPVRSVLQRRSRLPPCTNTAGTADVASEAAVQQPEAEEESRRGFQPEGVPNPGGLRDAAGAAIPSGAVRRAASREMCPGEPKSRGVGAQEPPEAGAATSAEEALHACAEQHCGDGASSADGTQGAQAAPGVVGAPPAAGPPARRAASQRELPALPGDAKGLVVPAIETVRAYVSEHAEMLRSTAVRVYGSEHADISRSLSTRAPLVGFGQRRGMAVAPSPLLAWVDTPLAGEGQHSDMSRLRAAGEASLHGDLCDFEPPRGRQDYAPKMCHELTLQSLLDTVMNDL